MDGVSEAASRELLLEAQPLRTAGPSKGFVGGTLGSVKDVLARRQLLGMLVRREIKARYKDSVLGFFWSLLRPLAMLAVYYLAVGQFLGQARQIEDFAIFIFSGLTAWGFFSEAVTAGTGSVVANSGLVKKVYMPRELFPLAAIGSALFNMTMQLIILLLGTLVAGAVPVGARWLYFPLSLAVLVVWATLLTLILSAVNVYLRDVQYLVEVFIMMFFWFTPIVYNWTFVKTAFESSARVSQSMGETLLNIYLSNPIALAVLGFQRTFWTAADSDPVLYPQIPDLAQKLGIALLVGILLLWLAQRTFLRLQGNFAQEL